MTSEIDEYAPVLTIGTVARHLGVAPQTIRLYESEGLVLPHKTESGRRMFSIHDAERLKHMRRMITVDGLNIAGIKRLLSLVPCWDYCGGIDGDCESCTVYHESVGPCWTAEKLGPKCDVAACRDCPVYRLRFDSEEMQRIVHGDAHAPLRPKSGAKTRPPDTENQR